MGKEKYSLVQIPLRTKVKTGRPFMEGKSPNMSMNQSVSGGEESYKQTLKEMKQLLMEKVKDKKLNADQTLSSKKS